MDQAAFGKLLREARKRVPLTLEGLARSSGVSVRAIGDMERGRSFPRQSTLNQLMDALALADPERRALAAAARRAEAAPGWQPPRLLPPDLQTFSGRREVLAQLLRPSGPDAPRAPAAVTVVSGMAGAGKTALALHWAHQLADRFPDGQLYVDLRGFAPSGRWLDPTDALGGLLTTLGVPSGSLPHSAEERSSLFREQAANRRMLMVIDNAHDSQQVRPLLPRSSSCLTIVTSRSHLTGLVATDDARLIDLDVWTEHEALSALAARIGADRLAVDPASAAELVNLCGRLPLAVTILGAQLAAEPALTLAAATARFRDARSVLDALTTDDVHTDVRTALSWSSQLLGPEAALVFRHLAVLPGPAFPAEAAAVAAGVPGPLARDALEALVAASLVARDENGRFVLHSLVREHAGDLLDRESGDRNAAELRILRAGTGLAQEITPYVSAQRPADSTAAPGSSLDATVRPHSLSRNSRSAGDLGLPRSVFGPAGEAAAVDQVMVARPRWADHSSGLVGRAEEREMLAELLRAIRAGESRALVLSGAPGIGKSALLNQLVAQAGDFRVVRAIGVQSEMELVFAGLHQLCAPLLDRVDRLPAPQSEALRTAFGLYAGPAPKPFLVGLAALGLLSEAARDRPLLCVVDDHQWLDRASAEVLGFLARRLGVEPIGMVFGSRTVPEELTRIPVLQLTGLPDGQARQLLATTLTGPLNAHVQDRIIEEAEGNPLALLEWLRGTGFSRPPGGLGIPGSLSSSSRIEEAFHRQLQVLPPATKQLLLVAAADVSGDAALVWRAATAVGIPPTAAAPATAAGLASFGSRVSFRHPLLRSAVYLSASASERQQAHLALVEAIDPVADPDRRVWHRAQAAPGPDEAVAVELERSAARAHARGGPAAAGAYLAQAARLSADPLRRADRLLAAAQANLQAGAYRTALDLLEDTPADALDPLRHARVALLRGTIAFASGEGNAAPAQLLRAAKELTPLNLDMAREAYLTAWMAAVFAGGMAGEGLLPEVCRAARELPSSAEPGEQEQLLDVLAMTIAEGPSASRSALRNVVKLFADTELTTAETLRWGWFAHSAAMALWDEEAWRSILERAVAVIRAAGAYDLLPIVLSTLSTVTAWCGDFPAANALVEEGEQICDATGSPAAMFAPVFLACLRGDEAAAMPLIEASLSPESVSKFGIFVAYTNWASAVLHNGLGRHEEALAAAVHSYESAPFTFVAAWALPELVEAAVHVGDRDRAAEALARLEEVALPGGTDVGRGLTARSRALLREGSAAERLYREAVDRLARTRLRPELGRAHLLFGEWLRREGRLPEARAQLRSAYDLLCDLGVCAFADRARRELLASGEQVVPRRIEATGSLTSQETLIARLACDGFTASEIGAQLFLSVRTVDWHLRQALAKLGIPSLRELPSALAQLGQSSPAKAQ